MALVACNFTTNRMMTDYCVKYYEPLKERSDKMIANDFAMARDIAFWKKRVRREWNSIEVRSFNQNRNVRSLLNMGQSYESELVLYLGELDPEDIGAEILLTEQNAKGERHIVSLYDFKLVDCKDGVATYRTTIVPEFSGTYEAAGRLYAKNPDLPHRQDFELVKWL